MSVRRGNLAAAGGLAAAAAIAVALTASPASAEKRTVTVTLLGGAQITLTVDVPPGTPVDQVKLPKLLLPIVGISETSPLPPSATTPPAAPSPAATARPAEPTSAKPSKQPTSSSAKRHSVIRLAKPSAGGTVAPAASRRAVSRERVAGAPSPANPSFSLADPGPAAIGVPNFFIERFRIPPFLLPIYQAAGTQYGVPWQILAAINEIETDYGRNLNVSTAGAVGWMQFLPSTWKRYGVDANDDGVKDPYNPVDAIFAAARYLRAAGATDTFLAKPLANPDSPGAAKAAAAAASRTDAGLRGAIFAYNHAGWYVDSVLLRAQLIGGLPDGLVGALTGLTQGQFPVAARATYAESHSRTGTNIFAAKGSPVIAVADGRIVKVGRHTVVLQDGYGNTYTYGKLARVSRHYAAPIAKRETARQIAAELKLPQDAAPTQAASAGLHQTSRVAGHSAQSGTFTSIARVVLRDAPHITKPRVRPKAVTTFKDYFRDVLHLGKKDTRLERLKQGSRVIAGTILGRIQTHVLFEIRPAGRNAPRIDPKPILDGWKLLETTAIYRAAGKNAFTNPTAGQVLLESKDQLERQVLADPRIDLYTCGRRDIDAGSIDRRVLATLEFLVANGMDPTVTSLKCGHSLMTESGNISEHSTGDAVDVAKINGIPILGHQGPGSITDLAIRRLLALQGVMAPHQIISLMTFPDASNTLALPSHADHIHIGFHPIFGPNTKLGAQTAALLKPNQWAHLIDRIGQIPNPVVRIKPSKYALPAHGD